MRRIAAMVLVCTGLLTGCWTQVGFGPERSGFDPFESTITAKNVASLKRAWSVDVGTAATTPAVLGSSVFITSHGLANSFNVKTGALRWQTTAERGGFVVFLGPPTITAGTLQATASNDFGGGTLTFDLRSGAMTGDVFIHHFDEGSIAATLQGVTAYHAAEFVPNGLIVQYAVFGAHRGFIEAVSPPDGAEPVTDPAIVGGHVVLGHGGSVMSFPLERCTPEPSLPPDFCQSEWTTPIGATVTIPAGVSGTRVAVGDGSGTVTVLDITTGAIVWRGHTGSAGLTPPAIAHGTIYVGSSDGHLYAFDADGCGAPQCSPLWSANTVSGVSAQPAVGADVVYVGGADGRVRAFAADGCGRATCPRLWTGVVDHATNPGLVTGPVVTGGRLYAATNTGQLSVFALRAP